MQDQLHEPTLFHCELRGLGWIFFTLQLGPHLFETRASWMAPEAMDELVQAMIDLTLGVTTATVSMAHEPHSHRWRFTRLGERLHIEILEMFGLWSKV